MVISFDHLGRIIGFTHPQLYAGREYLGTPIKGDQKIFVPAFHPRVIVKESGITSGRTFNE